MGHGLTVTQRRFVREYVRTGYCTAAALVAYDTRDPRTASVIATETLGRPSVQAAVAELLDEGGLSVRARCSPSGAMSPSRVTGRHATT